ncbi:MULTISPECIES: LysE family transporter [Modicisalibacter]|uniref:LysE family translocator n=1 Tax=Modicisalibacter TaxID=574347 RepID=UPI00100C1413|nr:MULTISPECIES: LysE family transporter [Halomonadaceae]MBZ9559638.1 LysE family transporter [Modicisalibacter sp. R2A 31.J]MBZ9577090.1 LysE family transporter [Modicisalibacter sp. MOD 31.J]
MLGILAYALGVMYTPGPVNLLGLNAGLNGQGRASLGFCLGVGTAMLGLFLIFGLVGAAWVEGALLTVVGALGCAYILYLAAKLARAGVEIDVDRPAAQALRFRDGLLMQLLNPKGVVATLPIATLQFPAAGIHGVALIAWSLGLALLAVGAPGSYALVGALLGRRIADPRLFRGFNLAMAILLAGVAISIGYEHVYRPLAA